MNLESIITQDIDELNKKTIKYYQSVYRTRIETCCETCAENYDFVKLIPFHPAKKIKDAWICLEILQRFGYTEMSFDSVLYAFKLKIGQTMLRGEGVQASQAICNLFEKVYLYLEKEKNNAKHRNS